jgi:tetratricopeptide (TPR) repeat protein
MLRDRDVIGALQTGLTQDQLTDELGRLLRVPEAWALLRDPRILDAASKLPAGALTPARIASLARLTDPQRAVPHAIVDAGAATNPLPGDLASRVDSLLQDAARPGGVDRLVERLLETPSAFASAFALAWPSIPDQRELAWQLLQRQDPEATRLLVHALLANQPAHEAAAVLLGTGALTPAHRLHIRALGEQGLLQALREQDASAAPSATECSLESLIDKATDHVAAGDAEAAQGLLWSAWGMAAALQARVADRLADAAQEQGDAVAEVEARRNALRADPTSTRRAELAAALTSAGQAHEALDILCDDLDSTESRIAHAGAHVALGNLAQARPILTTLESTDAHALEPAWLRRWQAALRRVGDLDRAVRLGRLAVDRKPTDAAARLELAEDLLEAGCVSDAAEHAGLVVGMLGPSNDSRRLLARALEASGDVAAALPHWQAIAPEDPDAALHAGECALRSGDCALALDTAEALLKAEPASVPALVLAARAARQQGESERAARYLDDAQMADPAHPEVIQARASALEEAGDVEAAGQVLATGVQSNPTSGELHMAHARWLHARGSASEALAEAERAVSLDPVRTSWKTSFADMLAALGHTERAQALLEEVVRRVPGDFAARRRLSGIYRTRGDIAGARAQLQGIPGDAPADLHLEAARLELEDESPEAARRALADLDRAAARQSTDPEIPFWLGLAHTRLLDMDRAYQAFSVFLDRTEPRARELIERAWLGLAQAAVQTGRALEALSRLDAARAQLDDSAAVWLAISISRTEVGDPTAAQEAARRATTLAGDSAEAWHQLRLAASQAADWDAALEAAAQVTRLRPAHPAAWLEFAATGLGAHAPRLVRTGLAHALHIGRQDEGILQQAASIAESAGAFETAHRLLHRRHASSPMDADVLRRLARLSQKCGDPAGAEAAWTKLGALASDRADLLHESAQGLWEIGRRGPATALWQRALDLEPNSADAHARLGRALIAQHDLEVGLNALRTAYELAPHNPQSSLDLGNGLMAASLYAEAREYLERAARLAPDRADILLGLSECLLSVGAPDDARQLLEEAAASAAADARTWAMLSLARMQCGDLAEAKAALNLAAEAGAADGADIWRARAARSMGDWAALRPVFAAALSTPALSSGLAEEAVLAALELRNARWIFETTAGVAAHLPPALNDLATDLAGLTARVRDALPWRQTPLSVDALDMLLAAAFGAGRLGVSFLAYAGDSAFGSTLRETIAVELLDDRQPQEALHALAMPAGPVTPGVWTALLCGVAHGQAGNGDLARKALQFAARNPAFVAVAHRLTASVWDEEGRNDQSIASLNDAIGVWPDEAAWHAALASCYLRQNDLDLALPHLQQAAALQPQDKEAALAYARALGSMHLQAEALDAYARVIDLDPEDPGVSREGGMLAVAAGASERAEAWLATSLALAPEDAALAIAFARAALNAGRLDEAAQRAERALELAPQDPDVLHGAGDIYASQGKFEKAIQAYDQAMQRSPAPLTIKMARARLLTRIGRPAQAARELQAILEKHPTEEAAWDELSQAQEAQGDLENALSAAVEAVRLAPRRAAYRLQLGRLCLKGGQLDRALDELTHAQSRAPEDASIAVELGKVFEARREHQNALDCFQRAIRHDPENAAAHYHAGIVLRALKAYAQAGRMFQRAVDLTPRDPEALHQLASVRALELVHGNIPLQAVLS